MLGLKDTEKGVRGTGTVAEIFVPHPHLEDAPQRENVSFDALGTLMKNKASTHTNS